MASPHTVLPGQNVPAGLLPDLKRPSKTLAIGPGLKFAPPSAVNATSAGIPSIDRRKNLVWIENNGHGRYAPAVGDLVIAIVRHSSVDFFHCSLSSYTSLAILGQLSFEGVNRRTRPMLQPGSVVYGRVCFASTHMDPEIECVHPSTGKAEGLGELKGGMLFDISLGMARRLMMANTREDGGVILLEELGEKGARFEIAVGRNGKVWINSDSIRATTAIGKALQEIDYEGQSIAAQEKTVKKVLKCFPN